MLRRTRERVSQIIWVGDRADPAVAPAVHPAAQADRLAVGGRDQTSPSISTSASRRSPPHEWHRRSRSRARAPRPCRGRTRTGPRARPTGHARWRDIPPTTQLDVHTSSVAVPPERGPRRRERASANGPAVRPEQQVGQLDPRWPCRVAARRCARTPAAARRRRCRSASGTVGFSARRASEKARPGSGREGRARSARRSPTSATSTIARPPSGPRHTPMPFSTRSGSAGRRSADLIGVLGLLLGQRGEPRPSLNTGQFW